LNPTPAIRRSLYDRLAVILILQQKFDEAEFYVADVLSRAPNDFFGNLWASEIYMFRKECDRADQALSLAQSVAVREREVQLADQGRLRLKQQCGK